MLIILLYICQKVKVEGFVKQPKEGYRISFITLNDTIKKLNKLDVKDFSVRDKVTSNPDIVTYTDENGYFSINARLKDTLLFENDIRRFYPEKYAVSDLMKKKDIIIEFRPKPCIKPKQCNQKTPSKKYVFVGKKINVTYADTSDYCYMLMDSKYNATYKIEQEFGEHYPEEIINFTAYDHNSTHDAIFKNYENVLIYVGDFCGELIYLKYRFFPVYKTRDGRWAIPFHPIFNQIFGLERLKFTSIEFDKSVNFDLPDSSFPKEEIENSFPKKNFKIKKGKAYPLKGIYVEDLLTLDSR
ncbi:hypothetical protein [Chryseobacterium echinoideorum]|uniref:hypothetical protein n=1 Tax=Chryseobacterium echinoideorum TaxID=1549648 RepID=UPI001185DEB2|nr:hypothetical protein [Chryseobacterium echinoideorum]